MRWHRHRKTDRTTLEEHTEAHQALHKAEEDLDEARDRNQEIVIVVKKVTEYGRRNNFTEMISEALRGTRP
jgi:phosphoglycerate-specific signal transduction histidine kinase